MTFDSYTVETDPFLIELRQELSKLSAEATAAYRSLHEGSDPADHIKADAAWFRHDAAKTKYERALKAAIGL